MPEEKKTDVFDTIDVPIKHEGREIILPKHPNEMSLDAAMKALRRKKEELETDVSIYEPVDAFPWDGANAFMLAMKEIYGWVGSVPKQTFFGKIPPTVVNIEIGPKIEDTASIIWGNFQLPNIEGTLETGWDYKENRPVFCIRGTVKKKHHPDVRELAKRTREIVRARSIYKGKAMRLRCDSGGELDGDAPPKFFDMDEIKPEELIFPRDVEALVETNVLTPIKKTELCKKFKIPLSRGILLEGKFGVGKTLLAGVTAKICQENGWTFFMIDQVSALETAISFARLYAPCVVFSEDIDRVLKGERTSEMDKILNTVDGVQSKSDQIITILTTNDVDAINQAMLRPGRLDAVISIRPPDAEAAERLVRLYARGLIADDVKLTNSGKALDGQIPAVIREVVERAKLGALLRANTAEEANDLKLIDQDLYDQAIGMQNHLELLNRERDAKVSPEEALGSAFKDVISASVPSSFSKVSNRLVTTASQLGEVVQRGNLTYQELSQKMDGAHAKLDSISENL